MATVLVATEADRPLTATAQVAPASVGIRLLDAPIGAAHDPRAQIYIVDQISPGTTITRHVQVKNSSARPLAVSAYAAAASISGGQFRFGAAGAANALTSWTTVNPATVTLGASASTTITVRVAVPKDAVSGEQYGVIWAQISSPAGAGGVRQINRVGVRMYLDVSGTRQASSFKIDRIVAQRDPQTRRPQVTARVRNTGKRAIDVGGTITLSEGPGGLATPPVATDATITIAPGGEQTVTASFDPRLQPGPWLATVKLSSGTVHNQAAATVQFAAVPQVLAAPAHRPDSSAFPSGAFAGVLVLLLLLVLVGAVWLTRRRHDRRRPVPVA